MTRVKERGCLFALNDFGSGLSSFSHLRQLPVNYLKIDGRFVPDMLNDPADSAVVEALTQVGRALALAIISQWAENAETVERLRALGVTASGTMGVAGGLWRRLTRSRRARWGARLHLRDHAANGRSVRSGAVV